MFLTSGSPLRLQAQVFDFVLFFFNVVLEIQIQILMLILQGLY